MAQFKKKDLTTKLHTILDKIISEDNEDAEDDEDNEDAEDDDLKPLEIMLGKSGK